METPVQAREGVTSVVDSSHRKAGSVARRAGAHAACEACSAGRSIPARERDCAGRGSSFRPRPAVSASTLRVPHQAGAASTNRITYDDA